MVLQYVRSTFGPYFWPFAFACACALTHVCKKCMIVSIGAFYLITSRDKAFKLPNYDPGEMLSNKDDIMKQETKTLILIRHGESMWNEVFNRGINWGLPLRALYALATETLLFVTQDSCLYDSPLSTVGISQAANIRQYIIDGYAPNKQSRDRSSEEKEALLSDADKERALRDEYLGILRSAKAANSLVVSSPLRRCIETVSLGLFDRLNESSECIVLHSSLQEMTRNIDGVSLSYVNERPPLSLSMRGEEDALGVDWDAWLDARVTTDSKAGFKPPERRGDDRMRAFVQWLFEQPQSTVIVSGHSLWNRNFFKAYLPRTLQHPAKVEKIANGGVVAVKFSKLKVKPGLTRYAIHAQSICEVIKGFEKKHAKKGKGNKKAV